MLKIVTSVIPALILSLAAFSAGAAQLPESLMDKDKPGQNTGAVVITSTLQSAQWPMSVMTVSLP